MGCLKLLVYVVHALSAAVLIVVAAAHWVRFETYDAVHARVLEDGWYGEVDRADLWVDDDNYFGAGRERSFDRDERRRWNLRTGYKFNYYRGREHFSSTTGSGDDEGYNYWLRYADDANEDFWKACRDDLLGGKWDKPLKISKACRNDPRSSWYVNWVLTRAWETDQHQTVCDTKATINPECREDQDMYDKLVWRGFGWDVLRNRYPDSGRRLLNGVNDQWSRFPIGWAWIRTGISYSGWGHRVNQDFADKMTFVLYGLFSALLAFWDILLIIGGVAGVSSLAQFDSRFWRGIFIVIGGFITLGVSADLGICAGAFSFAIGAIWILLAFCTAKPLEKSEAKGED
jgi:hypothetical protein